MQTKARAEANGLSVASIIFGIFAIVSSVTIIFVPLFAGLSLTFALLSRGCKKLSVTAVVGIVLSVLGLIIGTFIAGALISLFTAAAREILRSFPYYVGF